MRRARVLPTGSARHSAERGRAANMAEKGRHLLRWRRWPKRAAPLRS